MLKIIGIYLLYHKYENWCSGWSEAALVQHPRFSLSPSISTSVVFFFVMSDIIYNFYHMMYIDFLTRANSPILHCIPIKMQPYHWLMDTPRSRMMSWVVPSSAMFGTSNYFSYSGTFMNLFLIRLCYSKKSCLFWDYNYVSETESNSPFTLH